MVIADTYILRINTDQVSLNDFNFGLFLDQRVCILNRQLITNMKVVTQLNFYPIDWILNFGTWFMKTYKFDRKNL